MVSRITIHRILNGVLVVNLLCLGFFCLVLVQHFRYDKDVFNCVDMSRECKNFFEALGCDVQMVYGYNLDSAHAWIRVNGCDFECTELHFGDISSSYGVVVVEGDVG